MEHFNIIRLEETASTNEYLKNLAEKDGLPEGLLFFANRKRVAGPARHNMGKRTRKNLNLRFLLRPEFLSAEKVFMISKVVCWPC
jgi:hypothetical protein